MTGETEKLNFVPIEKIIPYARNPRRHGKNISKVAASIKEFGWQHPILVDKNYVVIAGHARLEAAGYLGLKEVPVRIASELTPIKVKAYRIADNRLAELSEWDDELLGLELGELDSEGQDLSITGFEGIEVEKLLEECYRREGLTEPDEVPEVEKDVISQLGDIWKMMDHVLVCGDSTSTDVVASLVGNAEVDMVFTDPPYNVNYEGGTSEKLKIKNDNFSPEEFRKFLKSAFKGISSVLKPGGICYVCYSDSETEAFREALKRNGIKISQNIIWFKNQFVLGRSDYQWQHEPIMYASKEAVENHIPDATKMVGDYEQTHEPIIYGWKEGSRHNFYGSRSDGTVWCFPKPARNGEHPTMKPVGLVEKAILNSSRRGGIVFDPFGGSGSTLIAAEQVGRSARLIELDPVYCDVIVRRWQNFTGENAINATTGKTFNESIKKKKRAALKENSNDDNSAKGGGKSS